MKKDTTKIWDYTYEFVITETPYINMRILQTYKTNSPKQVEWYKYRDMEQLEARKEKFIKAKQESLARKEKYKQERKETQKARKEELKNTYKVWDLFYYSWGYDQTNIEYFQITEKRGSKVYIKRIAGKLESIESSMSEYTKPAKDCFLTEDWQTRDNGWKIIWAYWISMKFWHLYPTKENETHFSSSRA